MRAMGIGLWQLLILAIVVAVVAAVAFRTVRAKARADDE